MKREKLASLHSRYNPQAEAERYISSLPLNEDIGFFILIEPGLGYIAAPLRNKFPGAKLIALHVEPCEAAVQELMDAEWSPAAGVSLQDFLEKEIPQATTQEMRLLEWRPALAVYGQAYLNLIEETAGFIKRTDANTRTQKQFGRRWFKNFFRNLGLIKNVIDLARLSMPIVVTGAGPALEDIMPSLKKEQIRNSLFILAASSSVMALNARGLVPDMVISTDGTSWAKLHLYEVIRGQTCPLAFALTASLPSQIACSPLLCISDGSLWQGLILKELKIPFIALPQRGTVTATALDLAFALTEDKIFIAGMDLANRDIRSHARPNSLERFIEEKAGRLSPAYSQIYRRSSLLKAGGSYGIYACWFEKQLALYPKRLYSLGKNNSVFSGIESPGLEASTIPARSNDIEFKTVMLNHDGNVSQKAMTVLEKALRESGLSAALRNELEPLLFSKSSGLSLTTLLDAIHTIVKPDGKDT